MSSQFTSVAKSRARYYSKGAPVQFVQVELLRMEETGNIVVTLTFKNIAPQILTGFTAHFRCKNAQGEVVMEDDFYYEALEVAEGESFGTDDAVYVSDVPLSSVEVNLGSVEYGPQRHHSLAGCQSVPLPVQRALPPEMAAAVSRALQMNIARFLPANGKDGWQCTCGAFNYNVATGAVRCSECGADKAALFSAMRTVLQAEQAAKMPVQQGEAYLPVTGEPSSVAASARASQETTSYTPPPQYASKVQQGADIFNDAPTAVIPAQRGRGGEAVMWLPSEAVTFIMKWAPLITAGASLAYVLLALLIKMIIS